VGKWAIDCETRKLDVNQLHVTENGKITNKEYQQLFDVSRETASRDLAELSEKGILESSGSKGAGSFFRLPIAS